MDGWTDDGDPTTCDCFVRSDGIRDNAASYNNATRNSLFEIAPHFSDTSIKRKKKKKNALLSIKDFWLTKIMRREETTSATVSNVLRSKGGKKGEKETVIDSKSRE